MGGRVTSQRVYRFDSFQLYPDEKLLLRDGRRVPLTPRSFDLLLKLVEAHGHLLDKETLLDEVWADAAVEEGNLNRTISALRRSLGERRNEHRFIETVPKVGYRFVADVTTDNTETNGYAASQLIDESLSDDLADNIDQRDLRSEIRDPKSQIRWPIFLMIAGILLILALALFAWLRMRSTTSRVPSKPETDQIVRLTDSPADDEYPMWTSDGRIRFISLAKSKYGESFIMDADGGNQAQVTDIPALQNGTWSPDGRRVIFRKNNDKALYLADANGANESKLPFVAGNLSWSPDGTRLAFESNSIKTPLNPKDADLFVYTIASGELVNVTNNPAFDADPSWSPDGKQIAFNSNRDGNFEIYLMNSDGSDVRRLTKSPSWESFPAFSPDGTQIAFNSDRENENNDVYLMNTDGSGVVKLTNWESEEGIHPDCWSPDGTRIVFISNRSGNDDIYVMNVEPFHPRLILADEKSDLGSPAYSPDGKQIVYQATLEDKSGELRIYDVESGGSRVLLKTANAGLRPVWSPDGSRIAFQNKVEGQTDIFTIKPDGTELTNLTNNPASESAASWSQDGSRLVFVTNRGENLGQSQVYIMNADGSDQHPLTPQKGWQYDAAWSPDGSHVAFACDKEDVSGDALDICVINADGSDEKRLLFRRGHDVLPAWSPDGSRIAFVASSDGNTEIYLIRSDGTGLLRVTRNTSDDLSPHWSPDGHSIVFSSKRDGKFAIYKVTL